MKLKARDLKRYTDSLETEELRSEILRLFAKLPQVQDLYAQELLSEADRKEWVAEYKEKIDQCFWSRTESARRKIKRLELRNLLAHFERITVSTYDLTDLYLHRVETATQWAVVMRTVAKSDFQSSLTAFEKAVRLMKQHQLFPYFQERCQALFSPKRTEGWYLYALQELYMEYATS